MKLQQAPLSISYQSIILNTAFGILFVINNISDAIMDWTPITEDKIWDYIIAAESRMNFAQMRLWEVIKIIPQKWLQEPWGNMGNGFWVVAIVGNSVLWFNDIENGFNISSYKKFGRIEEYFCNQDELEHSIQQFLNLIESGAAPYKCGAPQPITSGF